MIANDFIFYFMIRLNRLAQSFKVDPTKESSAKSSQPLLKVALKFSSEKSADYSECVCLCVCESVCAYMLCVLCVCVRERAHVCGCV